MWVAPRVANKKSERHSPVLMDGHFFGRNPVFGKNEHMNTSSTQPTPLASFTTEQANHLIRTIVTATPDAALTVDGDGRPKGYKLLGDEEVYLSYDRYKHGIGVSGVWPRSRIAGESHKQFGPWDLYPRPEDLFTLQRSQKWMWHLIRL
jgi:hypothetical protein